MSLLDHIRVVSDFPKDGIHFYDLQSLLIKPDLWAGIVDDLCAAARKANADYVVGIESRGFLTGLPVAQALGLPFAMVRKAGKLPGEVIGQSYALEYGEDRVEIQKGLIAPDRKVLIVDDLLATGGTAKATGDLIRKIGANPVGLACVIELYELGGAERLDFNVHALVRAPLDPFAADKAVHG